MAYVRLVTKGRGTILRNFKMDGKGVREVDNLAAAMDSLITDERDVLCIEVSYDSCDEDNLKGNDYE